VAVIVIDASALVAIIAEEPEKDAFEQAIGNADCCLVSAVNAYEAATALRFRGGGGAVQRLWRMFATNQIQIMAFDLAQVREASVAYDRYGKGINSKTRLNLGDCAAYALAKRVKAPLLFKGNDFTHTDLKSCL
jgi:ribonuclease VapC